MTLRNRLYLYYPLLLVALVFGLDRLTTVPAVNELGRRKPSEVENLRAFVPLVMAETEQHLATVPASAGDPRSVVFIGTSRSFAFAAFAPPFRERDPRLTPDMRRFLERYRGTGRLSLPMQDLVTMLATADAVVRLPQERRPDVAVLELSPFLFTSTLLAETRWYENVYPAEFIRAHYDVLPPNVQTDAQARLIFRSYNYKFRLEQAIEYAVKGKRVPTAEEAARLYALQRLEFLQGGLWNAVPGDNLNPAQFAHFKNYALGTFQGPFLAVDRKPTLLPVYERILELYKDAGIEVVLWLPPAHPVLVDYVYRKVDPKNEFFFANYRRFVKESGRPFFNAYQLLDGCNLWADSSHLSAQCYNLIAYHTLHCLEKPTATMCGTETIENPLDAPRAYP